jgi:hypothetical protein
MRGASSWLAGVAAVLAFVAAAAAYGDVTPPPWHEPGASLPKWAKSARVLRADQLLVAEPSVSAARRGAAIRDTRLPVFGARRGPGCAGSFLEVGPSAWVCDAAVELSGNPAIDAAARAIEHAPDGLPFRYYFVGPDGSFAYDKLEAADIGEPSMQLDPGFAVALVEERAVDGYRYGRTHHGLWVPLRDLGAVRPLPFQGEVIAPDAKDIPVAWVLVDEAKVRAKPSAGAAVVGTRRRFDAVPVLEESSGFAGRFLRVGDDAWIAANDVRHPSRADPPPEVAVAFGEKWIDVELATQTLVAYEGARPVFATLVSTGKGRGKAFDATPLGTHRIWVKLLSTDMDNLEDENAARYFRIEDVPWVQFFANGVGLHGAFWHRSFGHVRSHGCVNLAPLDAERLFFWTAPHLPAGWSAVHPTAREPGTIIRVR